MRPGPIQGDMVHPYLRRRSGVEEEVYPSPSPEHGPADELRQILGKTKGVPLFQEQAMRIAMEAAKFSDAEVNELRKAMATFRRRGTIGLLEEKMVTRMTARGYPQRVRATLLQPDQGFRRVRLSREPRRELRASRLRLGLAQVPLPGGVRVRAVELAADGILRARPDRALREGARGGGKGSGREFERLGFDVGAGWTRGQTPCGASKPEMVLRRIWLSGHAGV